MCALLVSAAAAVGGCARVDPRPDYDRMARYIEAASGHAPGYRPDDEQRVGKRVQELLRDGLTADESVQICLLSNRRLQAAFYEIGAARADVVQAGLGENPALSLALRWPDGGGLTNLDLALAQNIATLWQLPARKRAAEHELDRAILAAAHEASVLALEAKQAYFRAARADRQHELARQNVAITQQVLDAALARREAGAGSEPDVNLARAQHLEVELTVRRDRLAAVEARAALARLLGLDLPPTELVLVEPLAEPSEPVLTADRITAVACASRLDLQAADQAVASAAARVELERSRFLRSLELGLSAERSARGRGGDRNWLAETAYESLQAGALTPPNFMPREAASTDWVVGPALGIELPLFDQNQAQLARAEYEHQQMVKAREALLLELTQAAHVALERFRTASENARFYRESLLPLQERSLIQAREAYQAGRATLLSVLEAQRGLLAARAGHVEVLADAALATIELERVAGRPIQTLLALQP